MLTEGVLPSKEVLREFCERWSIVEFAVFGSALREDFGPDSDVDILVSFATEAEWGILDHVQMQNELAEIFERPVDLVTRRALEQSHNWIRRAGILESAKVLYGQKE